MMIQWLIVSNYSNILIEIIIYFLPNSSNIAIERERGGGALMSWSCIQTIAIVLEHIEHLLHSAKCAVQVHNHKYLAVLITSSGLV